MMHKEKEIHVSAGMSGSVLWTGSFATKVNKGKIMMRIEEDKNKWKCKGDR